MNEARAFEFVAVKFNQKKLETSFTYRVIFKDGEKISFTEKLSFPKEMALSSTKFSKEKGDLLQNVLADLHLVLGVSYYKLYAPPEIILRRKLSVQQADFWNTLYRDGLGEFYYRNRLDPGKFPGFKAARGLRAKNWRSASCSKILVGVGGGKESAVTMELLKAHRQDVTAFVLETKASKIIDETIGVMGVTTLRVERKMDEKLFTELPGAYNGHVPISAIIAFAGYFTALLYGFGKVVVGNEFSSDFGNVDYKGLLINHQWSKSSIFAHNFQNYTKENLTPDVEYFSLLRPFYEIRIVQMFTRYKKYFPVISSCNRNFRVKESTEKKWCGECAKCVFVFTLFSAFLSKRELQQMFGGNLYENAALAPLFKDLLGLGEMKPFDCVGTFKEMRVAFSLAGKKHGKTAMQKEFATKFSVTEQDSREVFRMQPTNLRPPFLFYGAKNVLLVGYAREGKTSKKYLIKHFPHLKIGVADRKFGEDYLDKQSLYDLAIKTAGMPRRLLSIPYTTATNLFFFAVEKSRIIGITGTKGKSTTATLIHHIIAQSGRPARLLGNIGKPMLETLEKPLSKNELVILELSSYQLEDLQISPHIAVALNLFPEHMDYHGDAEKYYQAKRNIVAQQNKDDLFFYNPQDRRLVQWAKENNGLSVPFVNKLPVKDSEIPLLGEHNKNNIRAAVTVARHLGIGERQIVTAIKTFQPLPHRLQFVGEYRGIKFYDDAISTTPESTMQALTALKRVDTIFLGGQDRGYDFTNLRQSLKEYGVKNVVLFPDSGEKIISKPQDFAHMLKTSDMSDAVAFAYKYAAPGGTCLLSCASPSYSVWKDFEEKGDLFQKEVKKQGKL